MSNETGRFLEWLTGYNPKQGRLITEDGGWINQADILEIQSVFNIDSEVLKGECYRLQDVRLSVPNGNEFYYSITTSETRHTIIYSFDISVTEGPLSFDTIVGATYTPGSPVQSSNLFLGKGPGEFSATKGATNVSGGTVISNTYILQGPNNSVQSDASRIGAFTVYPPMSDALLKVTVEASPNCDIRLALIIAEVDIPESILSPS